MKALYSLLAALLLAASPCWAAISPGGVVNAASFAPAGLPNAPVASGSVILVFGSGLAGPGLAQAGYPLPLDLAGTTIQVTVGGQTVDCYMIYTTPGQVAALLPSSVPAGTGQITVTYNGSVSIGEIVVAETSVGIFAQSQAGVGAAIIQNFVDSATTPLNTITDSAAPGQPVIIWATGVGAVEGDESNLLPGVRAEGVDVKVYIGGQEAQVVDYGRSGCCAGLDQIVAIVPDGIASCYAPVTVVTSKNGVTVASNTVSMAIAQGGGACVDESGFSPDDLDPGDASVKIGILSLSRSSGSLSVGGLGSGTAIADTASASFLDIPRNQFVAGAFPSYSGSLNACSVLQVLGESADPAPGPVVTSLDAGSMTLTGPGGSRELPRFDEPVIIYQDSATEAVEINGVPQPSTGSLFLEPGTFTFSATGGTGVGPFTVSETIPAILEWLNDDDTTIARDAPHTVTWSGAGGSDIVLIQGSSTAFATTGNAVTVSFLCFADASAGSFTIPAYVLSSLPVSGELIAGISSGTLGVSAFSRGKLFNAPGLTFGVVNYLMGVQAADVTYE